MKVNQLIDSISYELENWNFDNSYIIISKEKTNLNYEVKHSSANLKQGLHNNSFVIYYSHIGVDVINLIKEAITVLS